MLLVRSNFDDTLLKVIFPLNRRPTLIHRYADLSESAFYILLVDDRRSTAAWSKERCLSLLYITPNGKV